MAQVKNPLNPPPLAPQAHPYRVIFFLIFLPTVVVTTIYDVIGIFATWVENDKLWHLDELASILLLCALPFMTYHLFQLNRALRFNEETIRSLHQHNQSILTAVSDGILGLNAIGHITFSNASAAKMLNTSTTKLMESHVCHILGSPPDGSSVVSLPKALEKTLANGEIHLSVQELFHRLDKTSFPVEYSAAPLDPTNPSAGVVISFRDITREFELDNQLQKSQKSEAIRTLAGSTAHDLNNSLTAILSYTELTMDDVETSSLAYDNLGEVLIAANRAKELVKQLLTFSRFK